MLPSRKNLEILSLHYIEARNSLYCLLNGAVGFVATNIGIHSRQPAKGFDFPGYFPLQAGMQLAVG